jgi:hypothetical protein
MGWQKVIIGYEYKAIGKTALIPVEAKYSYPIYENRVVGYVSEPRTIQVICGHAILIPVYKNRNIKAK